MTARQLHAFIEETEFGPQRVGGRHELDVGAVYEALAYYRRNPEEVRRVEGRHGCAAAETARRLSLTPTD